MNVRVTDRQTHDRGARVALIAGLVAWLSFVIQPCVMAAPFAGTAGNQHVELSEVADHGSGTPAHECLHCVDAGPIPGIAAGACDDATVASVSPRTSPLDNGDSSWTPAIPASVPPGIRQIVPRSVGIPAGAEHPPRTVSLTVAYCVYRE